jgi:branched-subunit amino acid ABC-type transport system permease component
MSIVISAVGFGLVTAAVTALAAVGFTLQVGISNVFNFSYGAIMITGTYIGYAVNHAGGGLAVSCIAGAGAGALLSALANRLLFVRFIGRGINRFGMLIVCLQFAVIVQNLLQAIAGDTFFTYNLSAERPIGFLKSVDFLLDWTQVAIIILAAVVITALTLLLELTRLGRAMRATAGNSVLARACGIKTAQIIDITWLLSGGLCGLAGVIFGYSIGAFQSSSGTDFLTVVFAATMLGGLGRPLGAVLGALIIGVAMSVLAVYIQSDMTQIAALGILVIILLFRPRGLFGSAVSARELAT